MGAIEEFGKAKIEWFTERLDLQHGIPAHDSFGDVFAAIDSKQFSECFTNWVSDLANLTEGEVLAIDGKCLRRSIDRASKKSAIYMVSAWAQRNSLVLGQVKVDDKSNEIYQDKKLGYLTIVMDLQRGAVIFVGDGKGADALISFWKHLKKSGAQIEAVATDIGPAYNSTVKANLPEATLMFDHFHIIKLFNEKLTKLRRDLQRETENGPDKLALKGTR